MQRERDGRVVTSISLPILCKLLCFPEGYEIVGMWQSTYSDEVKLVLKSPDMPYKDPYPAVSTTFLVEDYPGDPSFQKISVSLTTEDETLAPFCTHEGG
jgi:uracil DNA glycosylase